MEIQVLIQASGSLLNHVQLQRRTADRAPDRNSAQIELDCDPRSQPTTGSGALPISGGQDQLGTHGMIQRFTIAIGRVHKVSIGATLIPAHALLQDDLTAESRAIAQQHKQTNQARG